MNRQDTDSLVVVAKAPREGEVKTRLVPALGPSGACELYACMLRDTLATIARARRERPSIAPAVCHSPPDALVDLAFLLPYGARFAPQCEGDLGARLASCFRERFAEGASAVVAIGGDSPTLPAALLVDAFDALARGADAVIGPTEDGGYYLIGTRRFEPALFERMPWSTDRLATATVARARERGIHLALLPEWYDVDEPADLDRLRPDLASAPHTRRFLERRNREP